MWYERDDTMDAACALRRDRTALGAGTKLAAPYHPVWVRSSPLRLAPAYARRVTRCRFERCRASWYTRVANPHVGGYGHDGATIRIERPGLPSCSVGPCPSEGVTGAGACGSDFATITVEGRAAPAPFP